MSARSVAPPLDAFLHGSFTALVTPFTKGGDAVDLDRLARHVQFQAEGGITGVVPCGTTGESPTLTEDEHRSVVERTIEVGKPLGLTVIAGAGSNNTSHAVHLHRFAQEAGANAALHVTPYYNKPSQEGLYAHFSAVADSCDLPIVLYHIPSRAGIGINIETVERLAMHPNIVAIKDAGGSIPYTMEVLRRTDLIVLSGDDPLTLAMGIHGGKGVISVLSNIVPAEVSALCRAMLRSKWDEARAVHELLLPLAQNLLALDTNPIPVKTAMALLGRDHGAFRLPLAKPSAKVIEQLQTLVDNFGLKGKTQAFAGARA